MNDNPGMTRRKLVGLGAATLATASLPDILLSRAQAATGAAGATEGIGYFARFGVTEQMIRQALSAALSKGGDRADVFFQHRVNHALVLEDGSVNRAFSSVELGVGVRVVRGDQTGYGFTEDLTAPALRQTALTAAAIADGPAREGPAQLRLDRNLPSRYPVKVRWEDVGTGQKLPLLTGLNEKTFAGSPLIKKVTVSFADESGAILLADSTGRIVEDFQPMTRIYLMCVAEKDGKKESNGYNVAARADLLARAGRRDEALGAYDRALELTTNAVESDFLVRQRAAL